MIPRRTLIVDFSHLAYKYTHGMGDVKLVSYVKLPDGTTKPISTNIQSGTSKFLHRSSRGGYDRLAVVFDKPCPSRKEYFRRAFSDGREGNAYKGTRRGGTSSMFEAIDMTRDMLHAAGVSCYAAPNYEADDLIKAVIEATREEYPGEPIDVLTGDADLLPLVEDDVSVFMQTRKMTWAEDKAIEKRKYFQVQPHNYEEFVSGLSMNKTSNLRVPYNAMLLIKLLRGDKSDNIPPVPSKAFPPRRVNDIISHMEEDDIDIAEEFRYGADIDRMTTLLALYTLEPDTAQRYMSMLTEEPELQCAMFGEFDNLDTQFLEERDLVANKSKDGYGGFADLSHIRKIYHGMNLNEPYDVGSYSRKEAKVRPPQPYRDIDLAKEFAVLDIKIPMT